jgi:hypothetical protein
MVDIDGTGDGDGGNDIWVMGNPIDGYGGRDPAAMIGADRADGADVVDNSGGTSMIGAKADSEGMPS